MVFKCRNIATFKFEEEMSESDPERSADFRNSPRILKDIIKIIGHENTSLAFFNIRKSREKVLKDILKLSFYIFIRIR